MTFWIVAGILAALVAFQAIFKLHEVQQWEKGVLYRKGRFAGVLEPGEHLTLRRRRKVNAVDMRMRAVTVPAQEMLTADGIGVKATLVAEYTVVDARRSIETVTDLQAAMYLAAQVALRDAIIKRSLEELVGQRSELGAEMLPFFAAQIEELGVNAARLTVKDVMLPGELKRIFAQVAEARQEAQASLERARSRAASMRSLANSAKQLEGNPEMWQLLLLDSMSSGSGNTFVVGTDGTNTGPAH